jgi:prepilin-type N-terminal cleavage/methylation domain-containing protein
MTTPRSAPKRPTARDSRGFTLIEVLVALIVFAVGALALAVCIPLGTNKIGKAGQQTRASTLASERAEALLMTPYGHGDLTAGTHDDPANPQDGIYYVRWVVEDNQPITRCKRVTVKVARGAAGNTPQAQVVIVNPESGG